jgi:hypothetical protein
MQREEYDVSFIRHGIEVPVGQIMNMSVGQRALLKLEREEERLRNYELEVETKLGEQGDNYELRRVRIDGKKGLVIERRGV